MADIGQRESLGENARRKLATTQWRLAYLPVLLLILYLALPRDQLDPPTASNTPTIDQNGRPEQPIRDASAQLSLPTPSRNAIAASEQEQVDWLAQIIVEEPDEHTRLSAIEQLRMIASPTTVEVLAQLLGDPDPVVREQATLALAEKGAGALHVLGQVLFSEPDETLRRQALALLARSDSPASTAFLQHVVTHDPSLVVREDASILVAERSALPSVGGDIMPGSNQEFYADIFQRAWAMPDDDAIALLSQVYDEARDEDIRRQSLVELGNIGTEHTITPLSKTLGDPLSDLRAEALILLADHGTSALHLLGQALIGDQDPWVRGWALELIARDDSPAADALLSLGLKDEDEFVRELARDLLEPP